MEKKIYATERMQISIEIDVPGSWGDNCSIKQLNEQAEESGINYLRDNFLNQANRGIRLIGTPKIIGVFTERK